MKKILNWLVAAAAGVMVLESAHGAQQIVNIGAAANDGTGDALRTAWTKANTNFSELYKQVYTNGVGVISNTFVWGTNIFMSPISYPTGVVSRLQSDGAVPANLSFGTNLGTMTSVTVTVPAELTVSPATITTNGTFAITKANQSANQFYAGPTTGSATAPGFRAIVTNDLPSTISVSGNSTAGGYVSAAGNVTSGANVSAAGNVTSGANVIATNGVVIGDGAANVTVKAYAAKQVSITGDGTGATTQAGLIVGYAGLSGYGAIYSSGVTPSTSANAALIADPTHTAIGVVAGGSIDLTQGGTAKLSLNTSGNISMAGTLTAGAATFTGIVDNRGAGLYGYFGNSTALVGTDGGLSGLGLSSGSFIFWNSAGGALGGTKTASISKISDGVLGFGTGAQGSVAGTLQLTSVTGPATAATALTLAATAPTQASASVAGNNLVLTAANATAGSATLGAANGGSVSITAGNAQRLTGGDANGGAVTLTSGSNANGDSGTAGNITLQLGVANGSSGNSGTIQILGDNRVLGSAAKAGGAITVQTGAGSIRNQNGGVVGGVGGTLAVTGGGGGSVSGVTSGNGTGGVGAPINITSGAGGAASGTGGTFAGGNGGDVTIGSGVGGVGTDTTGNPGSILFKIGATQYGSFTTAGNLLLVGYELKSVGATLTAAGTTRTDALQLSKQVNDITTAAASTGVILPPGAIGMTITVFNDGANPVKVYASASETIDGTAGATGVTLTNAKRCDYYFLAANTWRSAQLGVTSN